MSENTINKRAPNFSQQEKSLLLNLIFTYKAIIENKKTDAFTWRQKDQSWEKITSLFNAQTAEQYPRTKESLKKFYDNIKKNVRKEVAEEKKGIIKTGGGAPEVIYNDPSTKLALEIMNPKTVFGLKSHFDGDAEPGPSCSYSSPRVESPIVEFEVSEDPGILTEHAYSHKQGISSMKKSSINHLNLLQADDNFEIELVEVEPITTTPSVPKEVKNRDWGDYAASQLKQPVSDDLQHRWTKRRRPQIQQLTSSELSEEYLKLCKLKQEFYNEEKDNLKRKREREEELFNLEKKKLLLDIEIKQLELKKIKDNNMY